MGVSYDREADPQEADTARVISQEAGYKHRLDLRHKRNPNVQAGVHVQAWTQYPE
jgi:hypothetical protein